MFISYRYGTEGRREADLGLRTCPNCGHETHHTLYREVGFMNLFYFIPVWRRTKRRGILCEHCGHIQQLTKVQYEHEKEAVHVR